MEEIVLEANRRKIVGKKVNSLRREGRLPAILYGRHIESLPIVLDAKAASKVLEGLSPSALVVIDVDGDRHYALVREKQRNVILGNLRHVDFQAVSLEEKVRASVAIDLVGESPAAENYIGILVTNVEELEVESLPRELPERIEVDVSNLLEIGDAIYVHDLNLPESVTVLAEPDDIIVVVTAPEAELPEEEEEEEVEEVFGEEAEPEVIERGKREEEQEEE